MTLIYAVLIFCLLIFVHEFGHFVTAKMCGIKVNEFAIGMGPALFQKQKGETLYSVRAIPIGGFCAMEGEDEDSEDEKSLTLGIGILLLQGIATSIDALSVGCTISEYGFVMALVCALIIALTTFIICMIGLLIGKKFGTRLSGKANIFGGIILIIIGIEIFVKGVFF